MLSHVEGAESENAAREIVISSESRFSDLQRDRVREWIRQVVPECPRPVAARAVDSFLNVLRRESPVVVEQLNSTDSFPVQYQSLLLREVGAQLTGIEETSLRAEVARQRIEAIARADSGETMSREESARLSAAIKDLAPIYSRRLYEGRMEDDELMIVLRKARGDEAGAVTAEAVPAELTAAELVSMYARRNQEGSALQRLRAFSVEARLKAATGDEVAVSLYKLRPNLFRISLREAGAMRFINGYDGRQYWQQRPGEPPVSLRLEAMGNGRYLGEFSDPLYQEEPATFVRLENQTIDGMTVYRIAVQRQDGSGYIAWIDTETFEQVGREMPDKSMIRYSDFRRVLGVQMAFREEATDAAGNKTTLTISRAIPNPGLVALFFEIPDRTYGPFHWDTLLQTASASKTKP